LRSLAPTFIFPLPFIALRYAFFALLQRTNVPFLSALFAYVRVNRFNRPARPAEGWTTRDTPEDRAMFAVFVSLFRTWSR
jgi:hypothetical protein